MEKVFLDMAMSLDGSVSGPTNEDSGMHDWYFAPSGNATVVIDEHRIMTNPVLIDHGTSLF